MSQIKTPRRDIHGIFLLDKGLGLSSNQALQKVKYLFRAKKAGHTGSLDPQASGMLPICLGEATKFSQYLLDADKTYRVTFKLGETTSTGDVEGEVIKTRPVQVSLEDVQSVLPRFVGKISQLPSMYSALKHQGRPLYEYARAGIEIERQPREITVHDLQFLSYEAPFVSLEVRVSKGTYIRTLAEDIGEALGCGAHVTYLRRLSVANFKESEMMTLEALGEYLANPEASHFSLLKSVDAFLLDCQFVQLTPSTVFLIKQGQSVFIPHAPQAGEVRLLAPGGRFLGMGCIQEDGRIAPKRLIRDN